MEEVPHHLIIHPEKSIQIGIPYLKKEPFDSPISPLNSKGVCEF